MKRATMTAALGTDAERHTTPQTDATASQPAAPAAPATSSTETSQTDAPRPARQTLDRWPFSLAFRVVGRTPPVAKAEV